MMPISSKRAWACIGAISVKRGKVRDMPHIAKEIQCNRACATTRERFRRSHEKERMRIRHLDEVLVQQHLRLQIER